MFVEQDFGTPAPRGDSRDAALRMVNVMVDGVTVPVPEGTSVMRAAAMAGVEIPKLCATAGFGTIAIGVVPEPGAVVLLVCCCAAGIFYAWRGSRGDK